MNQENLNNLLHNWLKDEVLALSKSYPGHALLLDREKLNKLCRGRETEKIWTFLATSVRCQATITKIKSELKKKQQTNLPDSILGTELIGQEISQEEFLTHRLRFLLAKKSLLEKAVCVAEEETINLDKRRSLLKEELAKKRQVSAAYNRAKHFVQGKVMLYQCIASSLRLSLCLGKIEATCSRTGRIQLTTNPQTMYLTSCDVSLGLSQLTVGNLISPQSYPVVQGMVSKIQKLYQENNNTDDSKQARLELLSSIGGLLFAHAASDIVFCLQKEAELSGNSLLTALLEKLDGDSQLTKETSQLIPQLVSSPAALELHKLNELHVKLFMDKEKLVNYARTLSKESTVTFDKLVEKTGIEDKLKLKALKTDICEFYSSQVVSTLEEHLSLLKKRLLNMEFKISCEKVDSEQIEVLMNQISVRKSAICNYLSHNGAIMNSLIPEWNSYASFSDLLQSEKAAIDYSRTHLSYDSLLKGFVPDVLSDDLQSRNSMSLYFQAETSLFDNCLSVLFCHVRQVVALRQKVAEQMETSLVTPSSLPVSEADILEECRVLEKLHATAGNAKQTIKRGEALLNLLKRDVKNWWQQPAQFIPHVMLEKMSLKEWESFFSLL